jgi:putative lipoprotein
MFESAFRVSALFLAIAASMSGHSEASLAGAPNTLLDQDPAPPTAQPTKKTPAPTPHPISRSPLRMALPRREYLCADGARVVILFETSAARLTLNDRIFNMKLVESASTTKYSEGSVVWSSTGEDGFLVDNTDPANPKTLAEKCHMTSAFPAVAPATNAITGTVSYRQHVSLPPDAVVVIHLQDVYLQDAPAPFLAEFKTTVGQRHVPIPFTLKFDAAKIDPNHPYVVEASILVHEHLRFTNDTAYPVLTKGNPTNIDMILVTVKATASAKP